MKIIFMGTPEFALPSLDALVRSGHEVCGVITRPDRRRGRNLPLSPPPVKQRAEELGLRVLQPAELDDPDLMDAVKNLSPDIIAVVAYGGFLPRSLWETPPRGAINLHPSLLPKYRGAAPIAHAILSGDAETGVTVAYIGERMDAGDIVAQERLEIRRDDTAGSLGRRLAEVGGRLLAAAVRDIERGTAARIPQDESAATLAGKIRKADGVIDWAMPARLIARRVRAFNPWPGACTRFRLGGKEISLKILEAEAAPGTSAEAGLVVRCERSGVLVGTGEGCLLLRRVQPGGKHAMDAAAFLCGYRDLAGMRMG